MSNAKANCLTYPGQPDNVTTEELVKYYEDLDKRVSVPVRTTPELFPGTWSAFDKLTVKRS